MRRLRRTGFLRDMVRESALSPSDLILPLFIVDRPDARSAVSSMPGVERLGHEQMLARFANRRCNSAFLRVHCFP